MIQISGLKTGFLVFWFSDETSEAWKIYSWWQILSEISPCLENSNKLYFMLKFRIWLIYFLRGRAQFQKEDLFVTVMLWCDEMIVRYGVIASSLLSAVSPGRRAGLLWRYFSKVKAGCQQTNWSGEFGLERRGHWRVYFCEISRTCLQEICTHK